MSVTIKVEPQKFQPVYNEIICVASSTNSGQANFLLACEININGDTVSTIKQQVNLDGYFIFDIHKHLESYVSYDLDHNNASTFREIPNSFVEYDVYFTEEYTAKTAGTTISTIEDNGGGTARIQTATTHGYSGGETIRITGSSVSAYDGIYTIVSITSTTVFVITLQIAAEGAGGTVETIDASILNKSAANNVINWVDVPNWDYTEFAFTSGTTDTNFLTSIPQTNFEVTSDTRMWFNLYNGGNKIDYLQLKQYDGTTLIATQDIDYNGSAEFTSVGVGPWNLSLVEQIGQIIEMENDGGQVIVTGTINTTTTPFTTTIAGSGLEDGARTLTEDYTQLTSPQTFAFDEVSSTNGQTSNTGTYTTGVYGVNSLSDSYTIQGFGTAGGSTDLYSFDVIDNCSKFEQFQFLFIDRGGSLVSTTFNMLSRKKVNLKKTSYRQNTGSFNSTTNTYGYNSWDRGKTRLDTILNERITVNSNWINEETSAVIDEMLASPEVYHLDTTGTLFAIDILTNTYTVKTRLNDTIFNHKFDFEYSFKNPTQK